MALHIGAKKLYNPLVLRATDPNNEPIVAASPGFRCAICRINGTPDLWVIRSMSLRINYIFVLIRRTKGLSDYWVEGPMGLMTYGAMVCNVEVRLMGRRTNAWVAGPVTCRANGMTGIPNTSPRKIPWHFPDHFLFSFSDHVIYCRFSVADLTVILQQEEIFIFWTSYHEKIPIKQKIKHILKKLGRFTWFCIVTTFNTEYFSNEISFHILLKFYFMVCSQYRIPLIFQDWS